MPRSVCSLCSAFFSPSPAIIWRRLASASLLFVLTGCIRRTDFQITSRVLINSVLSLGYLAVFILNPDSESFIVSPAFHTARQIPFQIGTTIGRVVFLIPFVVTQYIDAIEVRLVKGTWLVGTALFQYYPTSWLSFFSGVLIF